MILVFTDILQGSVRPINQEVFTAAVALGKALSKEVAALMMGSGVASLAGEAAAYGITKTLVVDDPKLAKFSPDAYAAAAAEVARQKGATVILMGATFTGKDVMARMAQALGAGLAQDCTAFRVDGASVVFTRPMYAGKVLADVRVTSRVVTATLRSKSFKPVEAPVAGQVETLAVAVPEPKVVVESYEGATNGKLDVTEADIIVSGGRGLQGADKWGVIEDLAGALGAATGCSRPVSDDGWRPHEEHIGQTGKTVSPVLYIACGISGAIQHVAGMSSSKYIVAVNKDPEAPIFKVADYGIVGDVFEVLPAMTAAVRKVKG
ncbi:MAG: electron transfer flavoprotein subunit alpha/FixB family protein [Rhodothermales bacterium]|nr:electron transfer flavoprotein subunit alpha/FixB family protein [Rhodothermales bacterium]